MPYQEIGREVTRGTICRDHWRADVTIMCSDRIPVNGPAPLFLDISWRRRRDEGPVPPLPADAQPTRLTFAAGTGVAGMIRWDAAGNQAVNGFPGDFRGVLDVFGKAPSPSGAQDVNLVVTIDDDERARLPLSAGPAATTLRITAQNGSDAAPDAILAGEPVRLKAVPTPAGTGAFRWLSVAPAALVIRGGAATDTVELVSEPGAAGEQALCALFTPEPGADGPKPAVMAVHRLRGLDLERLFVDNRLVPRHLADIAYRRQLEAKSPAEVQVLLERAVDEPVKAYLRRLLAFVTEQQPLRAAPEGERDAITFIMGAGDAFYRAATVFFERWRDENPARRTLVLDLRTLVEVRDFLAANPPAGGRWGEVNVVVHANEEGGMSIPVLPLEPGQDPAARQANPRTLQEAVDGGHFRALPDDRMDVRSTLRIRGCALGRSQEMLTGLSRAFGGHEPQRPVVRAPRELQTYAFHTVNGVVTDADEFLTEFWFLGFPSGRRPPKAQLVVQFNEQFHPDPPVDWAGALSRTQARAGRVGDPHHEIRERTYTFTFLYRPTPTNRVQLQRILRAMFDDFDLWTSWRELRRTPNPDGTVEIEVEFERGGGQFTGRIVVGRPNVNNADVAIRAFLETLDDWRDDFRRLGHELADYSWTLTDTLVDVDGVQRNALVMTGRRTILRVQRDLTEEDPDHPGRRRIAHPPATDLRYFGEEVPVRAPAHPLGENVAVE